MNFRKLSYILICGVCSLLTAACSDDEPAASEPLTTRAMLSLRASEGERTANELINSWWIAFVDKNGVVSAIVSRDAALMTAVESETFEVKLPAGSYTAYAFANITQQELSDQAGVTFTIGHAVDAELMSKVWKEMPNNWDKNKPLPMSGFKPVTISTSQPATPLVIEVIRMVGKVEFTFSNNSGKAIVVNSVSFGPLAKGGVYLFPDYEKLGAAPVMLPELGSEDITYSFAGDAAARTVAAGASDALSDFFYVRESDITGASPNDHFYVGVNITRQGQAEERLYAITEELTYINRNDYIHIPITFTDYVFDVDILFYPPIGGYPAVITEDREEAFYATFGTRGKFVLRPLIREATDGSAYLQPSQYTLTINSVSDPDRILASTDFAVDPLTGELTGELTSGVGRAVVKLSVQVNSDAAVKPTYTKTIYIIRAKK